MIKDLNLNSNSNGKPNLNPNPFISSKNVFNIFNIKSAPISMLLGDNDYMEEFLNSQNLIEESEDSPIEHEIEEEKQKNFVVFDPEPIQEEVDSLMNDRIKDNDELIENIRSHSMHNTINILTIDDDPRNRSRISTMEFMHSLFLQGTKCDDDIDAPFVSSITHFNPFSYCLGQKRQGFDKKGKLLYPSPSFLSSEMWMTKPDLTKAGVFRGMELRDDVGVVLVDKKYTKKFEGLIRDFIGQLVLAAFGHRIALKVKLFEPKSFLQRTTDDWLFAPKFLPKAAQKDISPVERMKLVMAFQVCALYIPTKQLKPFNPLISETYQGEFETGTKVYLEQIGNNPNVSRFYILDKEYKMYGCLDMSMVTESLGSKITAFTKGVSTVDFFTINEKIEYILPPARLLNCTSENNRGMIWTNSMVFNDTKNSLRGIIKLGYDEKMIHKYEGVIIKYDYPLNYVCTFEKELEYGNKINFHDKKKKLTILSHISGSWLREFIADGKQYFDIDKDIPYFIRPVRKCLPSDGRFREDLIWLYRSFYCSQDEEQRLKYEELAQQWKLILEQIQREERELKKNWMKKRKKK